MEVPAGGQARADGAKMNNTTLNLTSLTVHEVAALYWRMLETQNNAGLTWDIYRRIPDELKPICPCVRKLRRVRREGVTLLDTLRVYDSGVADRALSKLGFDIIAELTTRGYAGAFRAFTAAIRSYYRAQCAYNYYG